jgi:tetratricopeptide (TPR) repeat protein
LVFVIGRNLEELSYLVGPLFKALPRAQVSLLTPEEAQAVAQLSEKNGSLVWRGEAIERVWELTHGHPYLLQHLCWQVWQRAHERGQGQWAVRAEDVEGAAPTTLDASSNALEWLWGGLPPAARVVAAALAKAGDGVISEKVLEGTLKESGVRVLIRELQDAPHLLVKWDIIEPAEGGYRFRVELLRRWIAKSQSLTLVQRELDRIEPRADMLYKTGEGYFGDGDVDNALEQLQKATRHNPNHRRANELTAEIHISRSAWVQARQVLERLAENYPAQAKPRLVQVLLALAAQAKEDGQQLDLYQQVLTLEESNRTAIEGSRAIWKSREDRAVKRRRWLTRVLVAVPAAVSLLLAGAGWRGGLRPRARLSSPRSSTRGKPARVGTSRASARSPSTLQSRPRTSGPPGTARWMSSPGQ